MQCEEFITLADPRLSLFSDGEDQGGITDFNELPQNKITDFT